MAGKKSSKKTKKKYAVPKRGTINMYTLVPVMVRHQTFIPESMYDDVQNICQLNGVCRSELFRTITREWLAAFRDGRAEIKIEPMKKDGKTMKRVQIHLTDIIMKEVDDILDQWVDETDYYIPAKRLRAQLFRQMFTDWLKWEKQKISNSPFRVRPSKGNIAKKKTAKKRTAKKKS